MCDVFYAERGFSTHCRSSRATASLAQSIAEIVELVVSDRPLFRAKPAAHHWFCHDQPTDRYPCASAKPGTRPARSRSPNDSLGVELCSGRFATLVASAASYHQRFDGDLRRLAARNFVSRSASLDHSSHYACVCHRRDGRFDETAAY